MQLLNPLHGERLRVDHRDGDQLVVGLQRFQGRLMVRAEAPPAEDGRLNDVALRHHLHQLLDPGSRIRVRVLPVEREVHVRVPDPYGLPHGDPPIGAPFDRWPKARSA